MASRRSGPSGRIRAITSCCSISTCRRSVAGRCSAGCGRMLRPDCAGDLERCLQRLGESRDPAMACARLELTAIGREGREFLAELMIAAVHTGARPLFSVFVRDLTERTNVDERLSRLMSVEQ